FNYFSFFHFRSIKNPGDARGAIVKEGLLLEAIISQIITMIGGENHQRVFAQAERFRMLHNTTDLLVDNRDISQIAGAKISDDFVRQAFPTGGEFTERFS